MEMHTTASLRSVHGLDVRPRRRSSAGRWIADLVERVREAERRHRDRQRLLEMSEHELRDIGLNRADVIAASRHRSWPRRRGGK